MEGLGKVLCVDDEPHVLESLERVLFDDFEVFVAIGGKNGLAVLEEEGPIAVVVSDMRMPEMNGATFLARVREHFPETVRMLLTGQTDMQSAVDAVNHGSIFRFLCKPCPDDVLIHALNAGNEQYRLTLAENELLENTLKGSIQLLTDVLSLSAPEVFSRASAIQSYVAHMAANLELDDIWEYELAAMLCHLGCITIPPEVLKRMYAGQSLTEIEQNMVASHAETAHGMLANISRFERIAEIVKRQNEKKITATDKRVSTGVKLIQIASEVHQRVIEGEHMDSVIEGMHSFSKYDSTMLSALSGFRKECSEDAIRLVRVDELREAMIVDQDILAKTGVLVANKGRQVDDVLIARLKNFAAGAGIEEPIRVRVSR